jgi:hypothetical protein
MATTKLGLAAGVLSGGLVLGLTACSGGSGGGSSASDHGSAAGSGGKGSVSCSGVTCSATLTADGARVTVFGRTVTLAGLENGSASIGVGDRRISCRQGDTVSAGPLKLTCATVTDQEVTVTARLG